MLARFVFMCPRRNKYAVGLIDTMGRVYCGPLWHEGGLVEIGEATGAGIEGIEAKTPAELYDFFEGLYRDEHCYTTPGWVDELEYETPYTVALYAHGPLLTVDEYAEWCRLCDVTYGKPGSHALIARSAKVRYAKKQRAKRAKRRLLHPTMQPVEVA